MVLIHVLALPSCSGSILHSHNYNSSLKYTGLVQSYLKYYLVWGPNLFMTDVCHTAIQGTIGFVYRLCLLPAIGFYDWVFLWTPEYSLDSWVGFCIALTRIQVDYCFQYPEDLRAYSDCYTFLKLMFINLLVDPTSLWQPFFFYRCSFYGNFGLKCSWSFLCQFMVIFLICFS